MFSNKKQFKIFCISFQRTGTTSVGQFFKKHGYSVATWEVSRKNKWTPLWFDGDYESIFQSDDFKKSQVFEDDPWWCLDFYKVLYHRFPKAKFILFTRDSDKWFDSMVSHSDGKTLGNTFRHAKIYRREKEYYEKFGTNLSNYDFNKIDNLLDLNESHRSHYKNIYEFRNNEIKEFFKIHDYSRFFFCELEDKNKWQKLGDFFRIEVMKDFEVHVNASKK